MADGTTLLAPAPAPAAASPPAPAPAPAVSPPAPSAAVSPPAPAASPPEPAPAPAADQSAEWRKLIAGEDTKRLKELERYPSLQDIGSAFFEQRRALSEGGRVKPPTDKSTPEEVSAFHKAIGVPEKADGYKITAKVPEGLELGDLDKTMLTNVTGKLHAKGATPAVVDAVHEFYYGAMVEAEAQRGADAITKKTETEAFLKGKYGHEYDLNIHIANAAITELFGKTASDVMNMQMADGTMLGAHPEFIEAMVRAGRQRVEDPMFTQMLNQGGVGGKSLEDAKAEILALRHGTDAQKKEYERRAADGGELDKINAKLALKVK